MGDRTGRAARIPARFTTLSPARLIDKPRQRGGKLLRGQGIQQAGTDRLGEHKILFTVQLAEEAPAVS